MRTRQNFKLYVRCLYCFCWNESLSALLSVVPPSQSFGIRSVTAKMQTWRPNDTRPSRWDFREEDGSNRYWLKRWQLWEMSLVRTLQPVLVALFKEHSGEALVETPYLCLRKRANTYAKHDR